MDGFPQSEGAGGKQPLVLTCNLSPGKARDADFTSACVASWGSSVGPHARRSVARILLQELAVLAGLGVRFARHSVGLLHSLESRASI